MSADDTNLETILKEVGEFGVFQITTYLLFSIPTILSAAYAVNYMISANTLDYRCKVPECDVDGVNNRDLVYNQQWLRYAIPFNDGKYDNCYRYAPTHSTITTGSGQCSADMFNTSMKIACTEFVYASDERNIQTEFNIHCSDSYKLALIGTVNNVGRVLLLPVTGLLSDRFGRLTVVVVTMQLSTILGLIKSFAYDFTVYNTFEFLESAVGAALYEGSYVLAIEWVTSKYRVLGSSVQSIAYALGEMLLGLIAMYVHDFRLLMQILYIPGLFVFVYYWIVPESVRWLLVTGRVDRAVKILKRTAKINGRELSLKSIEVLQLKYGKNENEISSSECQSSVELDEKIIAGKTSLTQSLWTIARSKTLLLRLFNCCYQYMAGCFGYYVLSLASTHIQGENRYISFMFTMAIEIPGIILAQLLLSRMNRRRMIPMTLCVAACSIVLSPFIPKDHSTIILLLFLVGKASMTCAYSAMFVFTAEMWPTNIRTTIMNTCLCFGRIGSTVAPFAVILNDTIPSFSSYLMCGSAILAGICVLFCPETYSKRLPDTIEEAKQL